LSFVVELYWNKLFFGCAKIQLKKSLEMKNTLQGFGLCFEKRV